MSYYYLSERSKRDGRRIGDEFPTTREDKFIRRHEELNQLLQR
jgi:hypothetical protein